MARKDIRMGGRTVFALNAAAALALAAIDGAEWHEVESGEDGLGEIVLCCPSCGEEKPDHHPSCALRAAAAMLRLTILSDVEADAYETALDKVQEGAGKQ